MSAQSLRPSATVALLQWPLVRFPTLSLSFSHGKEVQKGCCKLGSLHHSHTLLYNQIHSYWLERMFLQFSYSPKLWHPQYLWCSGGKFMTILMIVTLIPFFLHCLCTSASNINILIDRCPLKLLEAMSVHIWMWIFQSIGLCRWPWRLEDRETGCQR